MVLVAAIQASLLVHARTPSTCLCLLRHQVRRVTRAGCSCGHCQLFSVSYLVMWGMCQPTKKTRADDAATGLKLAAAGIAAAALLHAGPAFAGVVFDKKPETKKVC